MNKLIKRNQKKLLAVFSVLLMFVFIVSLSARGPGSGGAREEMVVAHAGKTPITDRDLTEAKEEWAVLMRTGVQTRQSFGQMISLPYAVLAMVPNLVDDIRQHPELFYLLKREAENSGIRVSADDARSLWVNNLRRSAGSLSTTDIEAVRGLMTIQAQAVQLAETVKISQPAWQRNAATELQGVRLNLVEFKAEDYDKSLAAPTPQQLQEQFDKYKNVAPRSAGSMSETSQGLGFGYQIPSRVKVQYFTIAKAQVIASLLMTPEKHYEWLVKAADYYTSHTADYQTTPTTQPATKPAEVLGPAADSRPATSAPATMAAVDVTPPQPTTKPFDQVSASIVEKLMDADVKKQSEVIEKDIASQLSAEWIAIRKTDPSATQPASTQPAASQPATDAVVPTTQPTLARLEAIRGDIQARYHVSVDVHELNAWQTSPELGALPGIGLAQTADRDSFNAYALNFVGAQSLSVTATPLQVWEPSQALTDSSDNTYVFRLIAAQVAHAPSEMTPLLPQITADWRVAQTYELAKQAAQKLFDLAKTVGLSQATKTGGQTVISTGQFSPRVSARPIPNYPLMDPGAQSDLGTAAQKLLDQSTAADPRPDSLAELPTLRRVLVIELEGAQLPFEIPLWRAQAQTVQEQQELAVRSLTTDWFNYDAVVARTQYKAEGKSSS